MWEDEVRSTQRDPQGNADSMRAIRRSRQDKAEACRDEDGGDVKWGSERQGEGLRHRKRYRG